MRRRFQRAAATATARTASAVSRMTRRGGGTAISGLAAQAVWPHYVPDALNSLSRLVLVSGTNGKTTTTALIAAALRAAGHEVWTNPTGSNLERGLAAALARRAAWHGGQRRERSAIGVFEVDEWALASLLPRLSPTLVVLLNLFRDQLDRYGEIDTTAGAWREVVAGLPHTTTILANADDPLVASVAKAHSGRIDWFGSDRLGAAADLDPWADVRGCPSCGEPLVYNAVAFAHLGRWRCPAGDLVRPSPDVAIVAPQPRGVDGLAMTLTADGWQSEAEVPLPGLYSAYNVAAAVAAARALGIGPAEALDAVAQTRPAFGRAEVIPTPHAEIVLLLTKNPTSANQVLDLLADEPERLDTLVLLNDGVADGEDVSWIWDVEFERLRPRRLTLGGRRAHDLEVRVKYAGVQPLNGRVAVEPGIAEPLDWALGRADGRLAVVATYTAMLDVRAVCVARGWTTPYWSDA
ncbi:MAG: MurT ligase domain-containing protein [Chloroflexi bacterium]|nr:MurT ligase domain-containing protein [Chloroflexota bacterium]